MDCKRCTTIKQSSKTCVQSYQRCVLQKLYCRNYKNKSSKKRKIGLLILLIYNPAGLRGFLFLVFYRKTTTLKYILTFSIIMFDSVEWLVLTIISGLIIIIFGGSIYGFFRSIYLFIFSGGDPDKVKQAWNGIRYMVLGIFLTLIFLFIFPVLFKKLGVPGHEAYTAQNIFKFTSWFLRSILDFGKEVSNWWFTISPSTNRQPTQKTAPSSQPSQPIEL